MKLKVWITRDRWDGRYMIWLDKPKFRTHIVRWWHDAEDFLVNLPDSWVRKYLGLHMRGGKKSIVSGILEIGFKKTRRA